WMPDLRNESTAAALDVRTPMRFDPFAWLPGTPASTNSGTVNIEPPPAIVFTTPATSPPATSRTNSHVTGASRGVLWHPSHTEPLRTGHRPGANCRSPRLFPSSTGAVEPLGTAM